MFGAAVKTPNRPKCINRSVADNWQPSVNHWFYDHWQAVAMVAEQRLSEVVNRSVSGLYVFVPMAILAICHAIAMYVQRFIHIHNIPRKPFYINVAVHLKQVGNQSANGPELLGDRLKTMQANLLPTSLAGKSFSIQLQKPPADQNS